MDNQVGTLAALSVTKRHRRAERVKVSLPVRVRSNGEGGEFEENL